MKKMQIHLTEEERKALATISSRTGRKMDELIREAVGDFVARCREENRTELLHSARGMWKNRDDLPDFEVIRREFDERGPISG